MRTTKIAQSLYAQVSKKFAKVPSLKTILFVQKRKITQSNGSVNKSPGCKESFNEGPSIFELASNTISTLDVTLSSLITSLGVNECFQTDQSYYFLTVVLSQHLI